MRHRSAEYYMTHHGASEMDAIMAEIDQEAVMAEESVECIVTCHNCGSEYYGHYDEEICAYCDSPDITVEECD